MSGFEREVICKCGHRQKTPAVSAFKCKACGLFNYICHASGRPERKEFLPGKAGRLGGYCSDCGMMKLKHERACIRCGGTGITNEAPLPARPIVATVVSGSMQAYFTGAFQ